MSAAHALRAEIRHHIAVINDVAAKLQDTAERLTARSGPACPVDDHGRVEFYSALEATRLANRPVRHCRGRELITQHWMKAERKLAEKAKGLGSVREAHIGAFHAQLAMGRVAREIARQKGWRLP